jgi:hypothetical protein
MNIHPPYLPNLIPIVFSPFCHKFHNFDKTDVIEAGLQAVLNTPKESNFQDAFAEALEIVPML